MKRVFILNDKASGGGAEAVMRDLVNHLHDKYEITVMTLDDDYASFQKNFPEDVAYLPAKIKENHYRRMDPRHYALALRNYLRKVQIRRQTYDVVISNKEGPCMLLASSMKADRKLSWVHVDYEYLYWTYWTFSPAKEVACMQRFDHVICVSQAAADSVKKVIGDPGNLCVRYNPINYRSIMKNAKEPVDIVRDESCPLFVAVGRIVEQKNFVTFAKVCARLSREFRFEVWIVGDGEQRRDVEQVLEQEKCGCVRILGMQSNPHKYLAKADFLVSTTLGESYGLVIQEALILGVPVLSTRCPAIEECLDPRFGMLVDCSEEMIEKGMRQILEHPECIEVYKKNIADYYDTESLWENRLQMIEELISPV